jgi:hypothetical protein
MNAMAIRLEPASCSSMARAKLFVHEAVHLDHDVPWLVYQNGKRRRFSKQAGLTLPTPGRDPGAMVAA